MTIIAVKKYDDKIVMCADSQETWGDSKIVGINKIIKEDNFMIGCSGYVSTHSYLIMFLKIRRIEECQTEEDILDFLLSFYEWMKKKELIKEYSGQLLITIKNRVFACTDFWVAEKYDYYAIGSGMFLAQGALACGVSPKRAVEISCKHDLYCSGEIREFEIKRDDCNG